MKNLQAIRKYFSAGVARIQGAINELLIVANTNNITAASLLILPNKGFSFSFSSSFSVLG